MDPPSAPPLELLELLRRDLLEEGRSAGVWSSSLNLAVAVTLVTCPPDGGVEQREEPPMEFWNKNFTLIIFVGQSGTVSW